MYFFLTLFVFKRMHISEKRTTGNALAVLNRVENIQYAIDYYQKV